MTSPFILNDNIICFIAFLAVFLVKKKGLPKKHKELRTPGPPPYLGLSPKKTIFWDIPLNLKQSFQLRKIDALRSMHPAHFARRD